MLLCIVVCMTLLASFFLLSSSLINMYSVYMHSCVFVVASCLACYTHLSARPMPPILKAAQLAGLDLLNM